jgi:hypothetical protein
MKRDNVTFDPPHDEHTRDFKAPVADRAAKQLEKQTYARRLPYANHRSDAALV